MLFQARIVQAFHFSKVSQFFKIEVSHGEIYIYLC